MPLLRGEIVAALLAAAVAGAPRAVAGEADRILEDDSYQKSLPQPRGRSSGPGQAKAGSPGDGGQEAGNPGDAGQAAPGGGIGCSGPGARAGRGAGGAGDGSGRGPGGGAGGGNGDGTGGDRGGRAPRDDAGRILGDRDFQRSLPRDEPPPDFSPIDLGPLGPILKVLGYVALALVFTLLVAWIASRLWGRTKDEEAAAEVSPEPLEVPLDDAEKLARAGRFAEAIHALLLETLAALSRAARLAPSLTSREILARVPLPVRAREALGGLVLAVEISRFGGAEANQGDYRACLDRFHAFLETYHRGIRGEGTSA
jgi:hypothetical protein